MKHRDEGKDRDTGKNKMVCDLWSWFMMKREEGCPRVGMYLEISRLGFWEQRSYMNVVGRQIPKAISR